MEVNLAGAKPILGNWGWNRRKFDTFFQTLPDSPIDNDIEMQTPQFHRGHRALSKKFSFTSKSSTLNRFGFRLENFDVSPYFCFLSVNHPMTLFGFIRTGQCRWGADESRQRLTNHRNGGPLSQSAIFLVQQLRRVLEPVACCRFRSNCSSIWVLVWKGRHQKAV